MPNYVKCVVFALDDGAEAIKSLKNAFVGKNVYGEDRRITFNAIVPCPPNIDNEDGSMEACEREDNWYQWRLKNWGAKWDACEPQEKDEFIQFETAWNAPFPVIKALAQKIGRAVAVYYADEGINENSGMWVFKADGTCFKVPHEAIVNRLIWDNFDVFESMRELAVDYFDSDREYE